MVRARGAHLGAVGFDVGDEEAGEDIGGDVSADEDGAVVVLGGDDGSVAQFFEALEVFDDALAKGGGAFKLFRGSGDGAVVAAEAHAVGCLAADADGAVVAGVAFADHGAFGVDEVAVEGDAANVRDGVLDVLGEGAKFGVGGEETAGFDDALLPFVAVEIEADERSDLHDGLDLREIRLGLGGLELLQRGLFGGEGAESVFVGCVGRGPEGVLQGQGVVVGGREFDGAVAAGAAAVGGVVADADGDANDALMIGHFLGERAVVGDGLVGVDVVETVLDEVGPLHAGKHESPFRDRAPAAWRGGADR